MCFLHSLVWVCLFLSSFFCFFSFFICFFFFFFSSRRRHTRSTRDWSSDVCSSDLWASLAREMAAFVSEIRCEQYETALDFQGNLKGALHGLLSGAARRIGFARDRKSVV